MHKAVNGRGVIRVVDKPNGANPLKFYLLLCLLAPLFDALLLFITNIALGVEALFLQHTILCPTMDPNPYKYVRIQQNKTQSRSTSCKSRVTNECDIRFVNGNNEPLYIYNLSEELSILFNYYYKVKSKIVINGKANIVRGIL